MINLDLSTKELSLIVYLLENASSGYYTDLSPEQQDEAMLLHEAVRDALEAEGYLKS